jgi:hypothetical protein
MSVPPEVVEVVRQWLRKAEHDLVAVRRIMAIEEGAHMTPHAFTANRRSKNI